MVERLERQRMGEIPEQDGLEREESRASGREKPSSRADTPRPDDGKSVRNTRGSREGVMRSESGSGKSIERAARKEVRWSKDIDYEG